MQGQFGGEGISSLGRCTILSLGNVFSVALSSPLGNSVYFMKLCHSEMKQNIQVIITIATLLILTLIVPLNPNILIQYS